MGQVRRSSGGGGLLGCPRADQISGRCITYGGRGPSMTTSADQAAVGGVEVLSYRSACIFPVIYRWAKRQA